MSKGMQAAVARRLGGDDSNKNAKKHGETNLDPGEGNPGWDWSKHGNKRTGRGTANRPFKTTKNSQGKGVY